MKNINFILFVYIVVLTATTLIPGNSPLINQITISDVLIHFTEFFILGFLVFLRFRWAMGHRHALAMVYITLHELVQLYVPFRDASISDWVSDLFGFILGYIIGAVFAKRYSY